MYVFKEKEECSGCTACKHICPIDAITMEVDKEGFKYPQIDIDKCNNCKFCVNICPFKEDYNTNDNLDRPEIYAAKNKNETVRFKSSSGGLFSVIAENILNKSGIVYGAAFDCDFSVEHIRVENKENLEELRGSKYVQSELGEIFLKVENDLKYGNYVLFSGTPCQVAGLKAYLEDISLKKLLLVDLVCLGVPSPLVWKEYLKNLKNHKGNDLIDFSFRSKKMSWHNSKLAAKFKNKNNELFNDYILDSYEGIFYSHNALRPSCHFCVYTNFKRPGDITLGDFWGIENHKPEFDDNKGVSLLLLNTNKAKNIFNEIKNNIECKTSDKKETTKIRNLHRPTEPSPKRKEFWQEFHKYGYEYVAKKYTTYGLKNRAKKYLKIALDKIGLLSLVKKLLNK